MLPYAVKKGLKNAHILPYYICYKMVKVFWCVFWISNFYGCVKILYSLQYLQSFVLIFHNFFFLAGESGSGKSHMLNLLLNSPGEQVVFFQEGDGAEPCTLQPQVLAANFNLLNSLGERVLFRERDGSWGCTTHPCVLWATLAYPRTAPGTAAYFTI